MKNLDEKDTFGTLSFFYHIGEAEVADFSAKHWDSRNRVNLIESVTPYHDVQVVGPYQVSGLFA